MPDSNGKSSPAGEGLQARIAQSLADREAAYRLRYEVYVAEQGKPYPEADHERRQLSDELDDVSTIIAVTGHDGRPVGTQRSTWFEAGESMAELSGLFRLGRFEGFSPAETCVSSRVAVLPEFRLGAARDLLFNFMYECGVQTQTRLCFMTCAPILVRLFRRYGFREYDYPVSDPVVGALHRLVLVLDDLDYLSSIQSPFLVVAERYELAGIKRPSLTALIDQYKVTPKYAVG